MATYYVSTTTGNNANAGTSAALPWATLAFALGAASGTNPGLVGGDIVYIAPGNYNEAVTLGFTSPSSTVQIFGDPLNLQGFPSVTPGNVYWYNTGACLSATSKNNITIKNIYFERANGSFPVALLLTTCYGWTLQQCVFASVIQASVAQSVSLGLTVDRCIFPWTYIAYSGITINGATGANYDIATVIKDCLCVGQAGLLIINGGTVGGVTVTNCTVLSYDQAIRNTSTNTTHKLTVTNCLIVASVCIFASTSGTTVGNFNHRIQGGVTNVAETNTITTIQLGYDGGYARLTGVGLNDFFGSYLTSPNLGTGTATGAPTSDLYGVTWLANPDIGAVQRSASLNFQQQANPLERNASTITIAPGSTSQSIELYLGVTGLTASTSGLSARYNRTRTASVDIPLVARTIAQAWTSGGFAEVDPVEMPGVYRLDIPNEALLGGADDCTVVVRGASGTNGAVITIDLRNYTFVTTTGYKLISDQMGANGILDVIKGSSITVKLQMVDVNNKPIPIGTAACTVEVYSLNNLVETYPTVIQYQSNGELTFVLDTQVTATPGTYNIYVVRNNGGSDTVLYGPMKLVVSNL